MINKLFQEKNSFDFFCIKSMDESSIIKDTFDLTLMFVFLLHTLDNEIFLKDLKKNDL
mgnify:CR=1 FL=1